MVPHILHKAVIRKVAPHKINIDIGILDVDIGMINVNVGILDVNIGMIDVDVGILDVDIDILVDIVNGDAMETVLGDLVYSVQTH
jgi:hypothetical protein